MTRRRSLKLVSPERRRMEGQVVRLFIPHKAGSPANDERERKEAYIMKANSTNTFTPGPTPNTVRAADGKILTAPEGWILLPPGDAALTRRVKSAGDHWVVAEKKGRKVFSKGVWASAATNERIRADLEAERATDVFDQRRDADARQ